MKLKKTTLERLVIFDVHGSMILETQDQQHLQTYESDTQEFGNANKLRTGQYMAFLFKGGSVFTKPFYII